MDMINLDIENRIAALEADNASLRVRIAELENRGGRKSIPPPPEPTTRVTHPATVVQSDSPDETELAALRELCRREYSGWTNSAGFVFGRIVEKPSGFCNSSAPYWRSLKCESPTSRM